MDALSLDRLLAAARDELVGRHVSRLRLFGAGALLIDAPRGRRVLVDPRRASPGVFVLGREIADRLESLDEDPPSARARHAHLTLRKHLESSRVHDWRRVAGERTLRLTTSSGELLLRLSGPAPALTLAVDGRPLASLGDGPAAWPAPAPRPERGWDSLEPGTFATEVDIARRAGRAPARGVLAACPELGSWLARELDGSAAGFAELRRRLAADARPRLHLPGPLDECDDARLAAPGAVALAPLRLARSDSHVEEFEDWSEAAARYLLARWRGVAFERRRRAAAHDATREIRRLSQLDGRLERDEGGFADSAALRRRAEALLAYAARIPRGAESVEVPDPYGEEGLLRVELDARLSAVANAERLFAQARRAERGRREVALRRREAQAALASALEAERRVSAALRLDELPARAAPGDVDVRDAPTPRRYLTSRGLQLLAGRGSRENHHLTFQVARPEDLWLHARDVPGSHVVLRDPEGRAAAADLREAAEVAAWFSEARNEALVDVHVTRRKHVRPTRGGPGRVHVGHSDTLRVPPRDPEGRLRRR